MNLQEFAKRELKIAGLFDKDSDYGGMLGNNVMDLIKVFAKQGHSGMSASMCSELFYHLSRYKNITPITFNPEDWFQCADGAWQSKRNPSIFSKDRGKTWYDIDKLKEARDDA